MGRGQEVGDLLTHRSVSLARLPTTEDSGSLHAGSEQLSLLLFRVTLHSSQQVLSLQERRRFMQLKRSYKGLLKHEGLMPITAIILPYRT